MRATLLTGARYDDRTQWPAGFTPPVDTTRAPTP